MFSPQNVSYIQDNLEKIDKEGPHAVLDEDIEEKIAEETGQVKYMIGVRTEDKYPFYYIKDPEILTSLDIHSSSFSYSYGWHSKLITKVREELVGFTFVHDCGAGAFGNVWLVKDFDNTIIALKVIPKEDYKHYEQEIYSLKLYRKHIKDYKNLIEIYDIGETDSFFYYTMEAAYSFSSEYYIPWSLTNVLYNFILESFDSLTITSDILYGTHILHSNGLAHHDIKPGNIIFIDGTAKLCDIGLLSETNNDEFGGTKDFIPPDFGCAEIEYPGIDGDLYAIGKVLYIMLTDKDVADFPQIPVRVLEDLFARETNKVIRQACANNYYQRFTSALELCEALGDAAKKVNDFLNN